MKKFIVFILTLASAISLSAQVNAPNMVRQPVTNISATRQTLTVLNCLSSKPEFTRFYNHVKNQPANQGLLNVLAAEVTIAMSETVSAASQATFFSDGVSMIMSITCSKMEFTGIRFKNEACQVTSIPIVFNPTTGIIKLSIPKGNTTEDVNVTLSQAISGSNPTIFMGAGTAPSGKKVAVTLDLRKATFSLEGGIRLAE